MPPTPPSTPSAAPPEMAELGPSDHFPERHLGNRDEEVEAMLKRLGVSTLGELIDEAVPGAIRMKEPLELEGVPGGEGVNATLEALAAIAGENTVRRSLIGMGYHGTILPPVIRRNILENPGWYTQYTPYQAEISQGRLEALLNFQTMITDLTGLPVAGSSLLDESTACAEAMAMCHAGARGKKPVFLASDRCHPQTLGVLSTRAWSMGIELRVEAPETMDPGEATCGLLVQSPETGGMLEDPAMLDTLVDAAHAAGARVVAACDPLALTLIRPPGAWGGAGADIAVGSTQRFGVPIGGGGPHAAYLACTEKLARKMPGRLVGVSKDGAGRPAFRLAIQTREQHIKRDRATSNICTAQVLLAVIASFYGLWHGPDGLARIARRVRGLTAALAGGLRRLGHDPGPGPRFDAVCVQLADGADAEAIHRAAAGRGFNFRRHPDGRIGIALDERSTPDEVASVLACFGAEAPALETLAGEAEPAWPAALERESEFLTHPVFTRYRSEHEMLRYMKRLENRDLSLTTSMIPLGSCTMKLNAAAEMLPITWPEFAEPHPYAPEAQLAGYRRLFEDLERWLAAITGFEAVSLQPNAGSQGEYAGLLAIRRYHEDRGEGDRDVCLIPTSAHGTNPASAVIAGMRVVSVQCDEAGNIDLEDLARQAEAHADRLAALMITYPSTHGVFEETILEVARVVHAHGGQVYMDGANMNAQVGLARPGEIGADVCHLNLHKTFCIPHGGGGPGVGPIGVAGHLAPYLPGRPTDPTGRAVAAAPYGSPGILPISWMYIAMMGARGLTEATRNAILNANYMVARLEDHYTVLYRGRGGRVAHEFILDCRPFEQSAGVSVEDIAKRLMDYGFHAPTMSWPVAGTLMVEPTESESKAELDRLCDALIGIRREIEQVEKGELDREDNPLHQAPHTARAVTAERWPHAYPRAQAAWPADWLFEHKFWPPVGRIDNVHGDRHLVCACPPVSAFEEG